MAKYYNIHISIYSLFLAKIGYIKVVVKPKKHIDITYKIYWKI